MANKVRFSRSTIDALLDKIVAEFPEGYKVMLVLDRDNEPNSWVTLGDLDLNRATQVINSAMVAEILAPTTPKSDNQEIDDEH